MWKIANEKAGMFPVRSNKKTIWLFFRLGLASVVWDELKLVPRTNHFLLIYSVEVFSAYTPFIIRDYLLENGHGINRNLSHANLKLRWIYEKTYFSPKSLFYGCTAANNYFWTSNLKLTFLFFTCLTVINILISNYTSVPEIDVKP